MDDLDSGLERERPDVLEALRSMNWEERLEKAREKRKAALSQKAAPPRPPHPDGAALAAGSALDTAATDEPHPAPVDERTLRGQTPVMSPGLQFTGTAPVTPKAPSGVVVAAPAPEARSEPALRRERSVAARFGFGLGLGLSVGLGVIAAGFVLTQGGPGDLVARLGPSAPPVVAAVPPTRPAPDAPGSAPEVSAITVAAGPPAIVAAAPLALPAPSGALPVIFSEGSPEVAAIAPLLGGPVAEIAPSGFGGSEIAAPAFAATAASPVLAGPDAVDARPEPIRPLGAPALASQSPALAGVAVPEGRIDFASRTLAVEAPSQPVERLAAIDGHDDIPAGLDGQIAVRPSAIAVTLVSLEAPAALSGPGAVSAGIGARPFVPGPSDFVLPAPGSDPGLELAALEPPEAAPAPLVPGGDRVFVHLNAPQTVPEGDIDSVTAGLAEAGVALSEVRRVPFKVSETQVRYFHAEDSAAAGALADLFGGRARDFTGFRPIPPDGTLEVYLAGESSAPPPRTRSTPQRAQPSEADRLRDRIVQRLRRGDHL